MRRLEELLRQMCQASKAIGNTELENKFAEGENQALFKAAMSRAGFKFVFENIVSLKGLSQGGIAVLGQFCAEVIAWCLHPYTKCSCRVVKKISNGFHQAVLTIISFW